MKDWLVKFAEQAKSEEELLQDSVESLPRSMLDELAQGFDPSLRPTQMDALQEKIAEAQDMGRELAAAHNEELIEKKALAMLAPLLVGGLRMAAGASLRGAVGAAAGSAAKGALSAGAGKAFSAINNGGQGGFNYGKVAALNLGGMAQKAVGYAVRNPGTAATVAGAAGGALLAPRDPQTGQKQYLRGAVTGGVLGAGANAISGGAVGNKMRSAVLNRESPILGQRARTYAMDAAANTGGKHLGPNRPAPAPTARQDWHRAGRQGPAPDPGYRGGPVSGTPKLAEEAKQRADTDRAKSWGRTGAAIGAGVTGARLLANSSTVVDHFSRSPGGALLGVGLAGAVNSGLGYGAGRLAHRFAHGPATGKPLEKEANRQTLVYDPSTKTFTRHHLTADTTMGTGAGDAIPAGHSEPAGRAMAEPRRAPPPSTLGPSRGTSATHSLHGGNVMSSSPARGVGARAMGSPPPVPPAARRPMGGVIGMGASAAKTKLPNLGGAVSLAGGLKKIARRR